MENSLDIFQERISQLEMLLSGDIYVRLEAVIGAVSTRNRFASFVRY